MSQAKVFLILASVTLFSIVFWSSFLRLYLPEKVIFYPSPVPVEKLVQFKDGIDEHRLDGVIEKIHFGEKWSILKVRVFLKPEQLILPVLPQESLFQLQKELSELKRILIVLPQATLVEGKLFEEKTTPLKSVQELKEGDSIVVKTQESIKDIFKREVFLAERIRRVILKD